MLTLWASSVPETFFHGHAPSCALFKFLHDSGVLLVFTFSCFNLFPQIGEVVRRFSWCVHFVFKCHVQDTNLVIKPFQVLFQGTYVAVAGGWMLTDALAESLSLQGEKVVVCRAQIEAVREAHGRGRGRGRGCGLRVLRVAGLQRLVAICVVIINNNDMKKRYQIFYIIILFSINFCYKWYSKTNHSGGSLHADDVSERCDRNLLQDWRPARVSWSFIVLTRILCSLVISSNSSTKSGMDHWPYSVSLCLCSSISSWILMILFSSQTRPFIGTPPSSSSSSSLVKLMAVLRVAGCGGYKDLLQSV